MAKKKKRKAPPSPPSPPSGKAREVLAPAHPVRARAETGGNVLLPLLGAASLVAAWLAALGGFSDGTLNLFNIAELDTVRPWLVFRDAFLAEGYPFQGWRHGVAPFYFPDYAILWPLYAVGLDFQGGMILYALLQPAAAAVGWILVCDRVFGKSPIRRALILLSQALAMLIAAWRGGDLFLVQFMFGARFGSWALLPWLLWLLLRTMDAGDNRGKTGPIQPQKLAAAGALLAGLVLAIASDLTFLPWLVAPAALALLCMVALKKMRGDEFFLFAAVFVLCVPLGRTLHRSFGFSENRNTEAFTSFNLERASTALSDLAGAFAFGASRNPLEALAWIAFAIGATWLGLSVFRPSRALARFFILPKSRSGIFFALFVPLSAGAALGAVVATGNAVPRVWYETGLNTALRYVLPALYFPLFAGWALLPWRPWESVSRVRPAPAVCALCAAAVLLASPKAVAIRASGLDPFNTPFHQCFNEAANRLGWRGGIANAGMTHPLTVDPGNDVEKMTPVGVLWQGAGQSRFYLDWTVFNRHHFEGDFQFVVANHFNGQIFDFFPHEGKRRGCPESGEGECKTRQPPALWLGDAVIRGAFGDPAEIVECEGIGLYHYDPPIRLDFSGAENPDFAQVGRIF